MEPKMRKKVLISILMLVLGFIFAGCGGSSRAPRADISAGQQLFNQTVIGSNAGCVTCHSLEADVVIVGPSLAAWSQEADVEGEDYGMSADEFTRQSILDPNAVLVEGFLPDTMPTNWGDVLTTEQLDNLVAYLLSLE